MIRNSKKRNGKKISRIAVFLALIFLLLTVYLFFGSDFFRIKRVEIKSQNVICADENHIKDTIFLYGKNILILDTQSIVKNLLDKFICIKNANLFKSLPDKVRLEIAGREGAAALINLQKNEASISALIANMSTPSAEQIKGAYVVDSEGVVFAQLGSEANIPKIYAYDLDIGESSSKNLIADCLKILQKISRFGMGISDVRIVDDVFLINVTDGSKIIFRANTKLDVQIASLQLILEKAKIDESRIEFIDLRFDKPVVRFAPKK